MRNLSASILALTVSSTLLLSANAFAGDHAALIEQAMSAAPAAVSGGATIMNNDGAILREGSNGWTCMPHIMVPVADGE